ncbi:MAG: 16S rRNA (guanine(527)-N(7))-methyltransferase RsmG [Oceanospirillales bacterium]|uniref:Ribosomal RNA small subunit methyltransferase G n=1 Tax=Marinobacterium halophilum TaxID=267374 RepID=A0A2P8EW43_9GAMM|nr:16S rRNA (guanine(527)-N(7))-methyltransferase RsmG [Marinobacterium halophilum]MBR9827065.1 16S rRNA (guanine(527)-N(7))-methyltransferase RsmG [Oceanospirillales bacterium]PSL13672.1 16S rRNA m(7)G-527 methyltransferase [Marinobacterium halophilum]
MTLYRDLLLSSLKPLQIELDDAQIEQLLAYHQLLVKWNKAYNLTAVRDPAEMVTRHLVDSLSVLPWIGSGRLLDVGSGPGLPGIPLAICRPQLDVTTLDSNGKKTRFQQQVKNELGLDNLTVINGRVEAVEAPPFDMVISRAFASIADMLQLSGHLASEQGIFLAMKGLYPESELEGIPANFVLHESHRLELPATEGERHLLILGRA